MRDLIKGDVTVNVYFVNGCKVTGKIIAYSDFDGVMWLQPQHRNDFVMLFVHGISTVSPLRRRPNHLIRDLTGLLADDMSKLQAPEEQTANNAI